MSGILRIAMGLAVIGTAIYAGFLHRSPWIIALLTISFTVLYAAGKWPQWRYLARSEGVGGVIKAVLITMPIQAIIAGLFYLVGAGVGALTGERSFATRLETFDVTLAGGLLVVGILSSVAIAVLEARADAPDPMNDLSPEIREIMDEAFELGLQDFAMPVDIFALSRKLADHPDRNETLVAMEQFFTDDSAFVRRVPYTALRFMGQSGRDADPAALDKRIVEGMKDEAVWVRYDAAWCAGEIKGDDAAFAAALKDMIATAEAKGLDDTPENKNERTAHERAVKSLAAVEARLQP